MTFFLVGSCTDEFLEFRPQNQEGNKKLHYNNVGKQKVKLYLLKVKRNQNSTKLGYDFFIIFCIYISYDMCNKKIGEKI